MNFCTRHDSDMCKILFWAIKEILNQSTPNCDQISNLIEIRPLVGLALCHHYLITVPFHIAQLLICRGFMKHSHAF